MNQSLEWAVDAAQRFAQLIHYHDNHSHVSHNYGHKPYRAWAAFRSQFVTTGEYTVVCFAFAYEVKRLTKARRQQG